MVARYRQRVSGPLLDRFDLVVKVDRLTARGLQEPVESTEEVLRRVVIASEVLAKGEGQLTGAAKDILTAALKNGFLTARGVEKVRRVGRTISALAEMETVEEDHIAEAMALRASW